MLGVEVSGKCGSKYFAVLLAPLKRAAECFSVGLSSILLNRKEKAFRRIWKMREESLIDEFSFQRQNLEPEIRVKLVNPHHSSYRVNKLHHANTYTSLTFPHLILFSSPYILVSFRSQWKKRNHLSLTLSLSPTQTLSGTYEQNKRPNQVLISQPNIIFIYVFNY